MMNRTTPLVLGLVAATMLLSEAAAKTVRVEIADLAFRPATIAVEPGDTIEWVNADIVDHTATARDGSWEVVIPAGATGWLVLDASGATDYYCRFHPDMRARIDVAVK